MNTHDRAILRSMLLGEDIQEQESEAEVEFVGVPLRSRKRKRVITPEIEHKIPILRQKSVADIAESSRPGGRPLTAKPSADRRKQLEKRSKTKAEREIIDVDTCFAGLLTRRKLKVSHDWFDPDSMRISVPYPMRYYVMPKEGQTVVSSETPEEAGVKSLKPEGVLYDNGNRVGPGGTVDERAVRMAQQPCEHCRFR